MMEGNLESFSSKVDPNDMGISTRNQPAPPTDPPSAASERAMGGNTFSSAHSIRTH